MRTRGVERRHGIAGTDQEHRVPVDHALVAVLPLETQQLKCPCHGGTYDRDGQVTSGPPPEPLARFATRVEPDGRVMVQL